MLQRCMDQACFLLWSPAVGITSVTGDGAFPVHCDGSLEYRAHLPSQFGQGSGVPVCCLGLGDTASP